MVGIRRTFSVFNVPVACGWRAIQVGYGRCPASFPGSFIVLMVAPIIVLVIHVGSGSRVGDAGEPLALTIFLELGVVGTLLVAVNAFVLFFTSLILLRSSTSGESLLAALMDVALATQLPQLSSCSFNALTQPEMLPQLAGLSWPSQWDTLPVELVLCCC